MEHIHLPGRHSRERQIRLFLLRIWRGPLIAEELPHLQQRLHLISRLGNKITYPVGHQGPLIDRYGLHGEDQYLELRIEIPDRRDYLQGAPVGKKNVEDKMSIAPRQQFLHQLTTGPYFLDPVLPNMTLDKQF